MVDTDSPNYQYGLQNNYYLNNGRTIKWWHGHGSFIDYTNPSVRCVGWRPGAIGSSIDTTSGHQAMAWWHSQMDNVLNMGLDGWKCDGTGTVDRLCESGTDRH